MKSRFLLTLLLLAGPALAADGVKTTCPNVTLILDPRLDAKKVEHGWGSGAPRDEANAVLALQDCSGKVVDRVTLPGSLARLDAEPMRGAPVPTYLVTVDETAEAGSYNGPLTQPFEVRDNQLQPASARDASGTTTPIRLALTGKAAWKRAPAGNAEDLLSVSCQPGEKGFVTTYRRYHSTSEGWRISERTEKGLWESDGEFPQVKSFP